MWLGGEIEIGRCQVEGNTELLCRIYVHCMYDYLSIILRQRWPVCLFALSSLVYINTVAVPQVSEFCDTENHFSPCLKCPCRQSTGILSYCKQNADTAPNFTSKYMVLTELPLPQLLDPLSHHDCDDPDRRATTLRHCPHGRRAQEYGFENHEGATWPFPRGKPQKQSPCSLRAVVQDATGCHHHGIRGGQILKGAPKGRPAATQSHVGSERHGGNDGNDEEQHGNDHPKYTDHELDQCFFQWLRDKYVGLMALAEAGC